MSEVTKFAGTSQGKKAFKILAISLVVLLGIFILKGIIKTVGGKIKDFLDQVNFDTVIDNTPTIDGSVIEDSFKAQAKIIADASYAAMSGVGTSDSVLFGGVVELNGAELQQVFAEFGLREDLSLFGWYASDLGDSFSPPIGMYSWSDYGMNSEQAEALGCDFWSGCSLWSEVQLMRAIWEKSGLSLSF